MESMTDGHHMKAILQQSNLLSSCRSITIVTQMNSVQIRFLSYLAFGKTSKNFYFDQYMTSIRSIHLSPVLIINTAVINRNERHIKQLPISLEKKSIIHLNTSLITVLINKSQSIWQRIVRECKHYYHGCKLLSSETKIAFRLGWQMFNGHTLTRRERKQLTRTMIDLLRLIPFSIFIIIPFMEFTLPFFLKLFPNMLPSTFQQIKKEQDNSNEKILQSKINDLYNIQIPIEFVNPLTLKNLSRSQLIDLCKQLHLSSIGPHFYLRWKLHLKFYRLNIDDQLIDKEGLENLTKQELYNACQERGINSFDISIEQRQSQLQLWINLHVHKGIPIINLILSNICNSTTVNDRHISKKEKSMKIVHPKIDVKNHQFPQFFPIEQLKTRSTQTSSKCIDDLVVHLSQSSHRQQRMY